MDCLLGSKLVRLFLVEVLTQNTFNQLFNHKSIEQLFNHKARSSIACDFIIRLVLISIVYEPFFANNDIGLQMILSGVSFEKFQSFFDSCDHNFFIKHSKTDLIRIRTKTQYLTTLNK